MARQFDALQAPIATSLVLTTALAAFTTPLAARRHRLACENRSFPNPADRSMPQAAERKPYEVRHSAIHGRGVFATDTIPRGERIIEYKGQRVSWDEAMDARTAIPTIPRTRSCSSSTTAA